MGVRIRAKSGVHFQLRELFNRRQESYVCHVKMADRSCKRVRTATFVSFFPFSLQKTVARSESFDDQG